MRNRAAVGIAFFAAAATCVAIYLPTLPLLRQTGGLALYPLDDTYIHLAIGRTLAESGVWGVAPAAPAAASSSPLWTIVLAVGRFVFPGDVAYSWLPLALNVLAGIALITVWARILVATTRATAGGLLALTLCSGLPALVLIGLEHVLQCLATTLLAWTAAGCLANAKQRPVALGLLCALATATRYESLFLVLPIVVVLVVHNRRADAFAALSGALAPVCVFGAYSVLQGGTFLPNSLILKGPAVTDRGLAEAAELVGANLYRNINGTLVGAPKGLIQLTLLALVAALWTLRRFGSTRDRHLSLFALWAVAIHTVLGQFGWLYRYEAWLVALCAIVILRIAIDVSRASRTSLVAPAILALALAPRALAGSIDTAHAPADRLWEHFGPAAVLRDPAVANRAILANDIGVLAYTHRGRPVDLYGLADNLPVAYRRGGAYGPDQVADVARRRGAEVGVVQLCWREVVSRFPSGWQLIEVWQGPRNVVFGDRTVGFIAAPDAADLLHEVLKEAAVPTGVDRWSSRDPRVMQFNSAGDKYAAAYDGVCQY